MLQSLLLTTGPVCQERLSEPLLSNGRRWFSEASSQAPSQIFWS